MSDHVKYLLTIVKMSDVKQILEISGDTREARAQARKERLDAAEKKRKRPDNLNREVFALLVDQEPQMLPKAAVAAVDDNNEDEAGENKIVKRPKLDRRVDPWAWHSFKNPARVDEFQLNHWVKVKEQGEVYQFARFNKKLEVISYTNEEYKAVIEPISNDYDHKNLQQWCDWTKIETDVLFELCTRFQLRFIVIADRFQSELAEAVKSATISGKKREQKGILKSDRSVDELKDRYYTVSKVILQSRKELNHPIVTQPFNYEQEIRRKNNLEKIFMRTKEQIQKEKDIFVSLKKVDMKLKKEEKEERNLARLIQNDFEEMKDVSHIKKVQGATLLTNRFQTKLPVSEKMQMQISATLQGMKIKAADLHPSQAVLEEFENLREQLLILFSLDKYIADREEEHGLVKEQAVEYNTLKMVYEESHNQAEIYKKQLALARARDQEIQMERQRSYTQQQMLMQQSQAQQQQQQVQNQQSQQQHQQQQQQQMVERQQQQVMPTVQAPQQQQSVQQHKIIKPLQPQEQNPQPIRENSHSNENQSQNLKKKAPPLVVETAAAVQQPRVTSTRRQQQQQQSQATTPKIKEPESTLPAEEYVGAPDIDDAIAASKKSRKPSVPSKPKQLKGTSVKEPQTPVKQPSQAGDEGTEEEAKMGDSQSADKKAPSGQNSAKKQLKSSSASKPKRGAAATVGQTKTTSK